MNALVYNWQSRSFTHLWTHWEELAFSTRSSIHFIQQTLIEHLSHAKRCSRPRKDTAGDGLNCSPLKFVCHVLSPSTSECGCTWKWGLEEATRLKGSLRVVLNLEWLVSLKEEGIWQREDGGDGCLQGDERPQENRPCWPRDLGLAAVRPAGKYTWVILALQSLPGGPRKSTPNCEEDQALSSSGSVHQALLSWRLGE